MTKFYSQYRQDEFISTVIFDNKKDGFFIEIGAHDGISFSNTYFFEKTLNWDGVCVEPNPDVFIQLQNNRTCKTYNCAIGDEEGNLKYLKISGYGEMLSGIIADYDIKHVERINNTLEKFGGDKEIIEVEVRPLNSLTYLKKKQIDFISIDTEGNELKILKSIDLLNLKIKVIAVENNYKNELFSKFLNEYGYLLISKLGGDEIYILKEFYTLEVKVKYIFWRVNNIFKLYYIKLKRKLGKLIEKN